jgi:hypothetical protein
MLAIDARSSLSALNSPAVHSDSPAALSLVRQLALKLLSAHKTPSTVAKLSRRAETRV